MQFSEDTDYSLSEDDVPILAKDLKVDANLELSNPESVVQEIIQTSVRKVNSKEDKVRELKRAVSLPSTYVFASLSSRIYEYDKDGTDRSGKIVHGRMDKELVNWQLLTVAHSYDRLLKSFRNGYFGAAYWNPCMQQVIIVHSGTRNYGGVFADVKGVILNGYTSQIQSSITFTSKIIDILRKIGGAHESNRGPYIQLFFTGHSLGAWLSQITSFAAKYMERNNGIFSASKDFEKTGYHTMAVLFDSPGCKSMLQRIQDGLMDRSNPSLISSLNITAYVGAPNLVNTCNAYVGDLYKIFISLSEEEKNSWWNMNVKYTPLMHQIQKIKEVFNTESGEVLSDDTGELKIMKVLDWPLLFAENENMTHINKIVSFVQKVASLMPINWYPNFYQELEDFYKWANKSNDFHPNEGSLTFKIGETDYRTVRYKTKNLNKDYRNERNINVFTHSERQFLEKYKFLMQYLDLQRDLALKNLLPFLDEELIDAAKMLKEYEIQNEVIRSRQLQQFVPFVKRMLHFFPAIKYKVEKFYHNLPTNICIELYQRASFACLNSVEKSLKFADTLGLAKFLNDDDRTIFQVIQSSISIGFARIYTIFNSLNSDYSDIKNHIFLNLDMIFCLEWTLLNKTLKALTINQKYLLAIACNRMLDYKTKKFFDKLFKVSKVAPCLKIILVVEPNRDMQELLEKCISNNGLNSSYQVKDDIEVRFTDLAAESQKELLDKKVIFQGNVVSLSLVIGPNNAELNAILDSDTIMQLIKNKRIEIGKALPTLGKKKNYYIDRSLIRKMKINEEALRTFLKNSTDLFAISCNAEDEQSILAKWETLRSIQQEKDINNPKIFSVLCGKDDEADLKNLCKNYPGYNLHWFKYDGEDFIWLRSYGSITELRNCLEISSSILSIDNIDSFDGNFVILAAKPGMGKSTALTHLGIQGVKRETNFKWYIRLNLAEHRGALDKAINFKDVGNIVAFLHAADENTVSCKLTRKLMKSYFHGNGDIVLLFDGFDEITPNAQGNFIKLLKALRRTQVKKIFITTRLQFQIQLEDILSTFAYTFQPFSQENQKQFLNQFWKHCPSVNINEECLDDYVNKLLSFISESIHDGERNFMGVPLQMQMIAEAFQDELSYELVLPQDFNILELYNRFIQKKYRIYFNKMGINIDLNDEVQNDWFITRITKAHANLAFSALFPYEESKSLRSKPPTKAEEEAMNLIGIVQFINHEIIFIHRTFEEYFAAKFLADKLSRKSSELKYTETLKFLEREYFRSKNEVIKAFLHYYLAKQKILIHAFNGKLDDVRASVASGTTSRTDALGRNALHYAAEKEHADIVELLLQNNLLLNVADRLGKPPLHYAARYNHNTSVISLLINSDPKFINARDKKGYTAVLYAAGHDRWNIVEYLIKKGATIEDLDKNSVILNYASHNNFTPFKFFVHQKTYVNAQNDLDNTLLHIAVQRKDIGIINLLLEEGANANICDSSGKTPIKYAAERGHWSIVESLLQKNAYFHDLNDAQKFSLLKYSAQISHWDIVTLFMTDTNREAFLNLLSEQQELELLYFCISTRNLYIVDYLLEKDTEWRDFNISNNKSNSHSSSSNSWSIIDLFIKTGANLSNLNIKQKLLLLNYSAQNSQWDIVSQFMKDDDKVFYFGCLRYYHYFPYLYHLISDGPVELARFFTESLFSNQNIKNVEATDNLGKTLLHFAAENGNLDTVQYLVDEKGAQLDTVTNLGSTPLHLASQNNKLDVVQYLIRKGANLKIVNADGKTCENIAYEKGYLALENFLKDVTKAQE